MPSDSLARIVLVDVHPVFRFGVSTTVADFRLGEVVGQTGSGDEALALVRQMEPDVAVIEIRLSPGKPNGIDIAKIWADSAPELKVLILSSHSVDAYIRSAVDIGVKGYLLKNESQSSIANGIKAVVQGEVVFSNEIHQKIRVWNAEHTRRSETYGRPALTLRETQVIQLSSEGLSIKEISLRMSVSPSTVQSHMTKILSKLGARTRIEAIIEAARRGLVVIEAE